MALTKVETNDIACAENRKNGKEVSGKSNKRKGALNNEMRKCKFVVDFCLKKNWIFIQWPRKHRKWERWVAHKRWHMWWHQFIWFGDVCHGTNAFESHCVACTDNRKNGKKDSGNSARGPNGDKEEPPKDGSNKEVKSGTNKSQEGNTAKENGAKLKKHKKMTGDELLKFGCDHGCKGNSLVKKWINRKVINEEKCIVCMSKIEEQKDNSGGHIACHCCDTDFKIRDKPELEGSRCKFVLCESCHKRVPMEDSRPSRCNRKKCNYVT